MTHFNLDGCKNPYKRSESCAIHSSNGSLVGRLGITYLWRDGWEGSGFTLGINTNIGNEDGENVYLFDRITKE